MNRLLSNLFQDLSITCRPKLNIGGTLTSPVLSGGCGTLTITWSRASTKVGSQYLVEIKNSEGTVLKSETHVEAEL